MSWQATEWVRITRVGDSKLKLLLLMLCNYANEDAESWYSQEQISFDTEIPVRTLRRKLEELQEMGFIEVTQRASDSGVKRNSLIRVLTGPAANLAGGEHRRPKSGVSTGQNEGDPSATRVAAVNLNHSNHKKHTARAKEEVYSEEFENLWQAYPRTKNTSKKKAWDLYRMLNDENQERVRAAVPLFAAAMRAEGRPEDKIMHMTTWLNGRTYETVSAPASTAATAGPAKPFWETATRKQWVDALVQWSYNWNWKKMWGPEPEDPLRPNPAGSPKHHVPQDILDRFDLKYRGHLYSPEQKQEIRERVEQASKHAVDNGLAACDTRATEQPHTSR